MTVIAKETRTRSGYVLDDAPQTIKIKANETMTLEFRNQPKGSLIIVKKDSVTGKPLQGAEFKITTASGELVPDNEGLPFGVLKKVSVWASFAETTTVWEVVSNSYPSTVFVSVTTYVPGVSFKSTI